MVGLNRKAKIALGVLAVLGISYVAVEKYDESRRRDAMMASTCLAFDFSYDEVQHTDLGITNKCGIPVSVQYYFAEQSLRQCGSTDYICNAFIAAGDRFTYRMDLYGKEKPYDPRNLRVLVCRGNTTCFTSPNDLGHPVQVDAAIKAWYGNRDPARALP